MRYIKSAAEIVGKNLKRGAIVVLESTVYPGVTEEVVAPILEKESGLKCGIDFKIGYSPERINPGDKIHRLETIVKVVSPKIGDKIEFIGSDELSGISKFTNYSQEYLSLLCRQGKLKGKKIGRNWVTTKEWLDKYQAKTQYANGAKPAKINVRIEKEKAPQLFNIFKKV